MKGALLLAAAGMLGFAQADVQKLKLKKVPLAKQLVCLPFPIPPFCIDDDAR